MFTRKSLWLWWLLPAVGGACSPDGHTYPYRDIYGHHYKKPVHLFRDSDGDGIINFFDRNDRNPHLRFTYAQIRRDAPYYATYRSRYYDSVRQCTVYVGPRGGHYYINARGNKIYLPQH